MGALPVDILNQLGITNYVVPFFMLFAVTYGILMKTKFLSERGDVNAVIAFAISFLSVVLGVGKILNAILPLMITFLIIAFIILFVFMFLGAKEDSIVNFIKQPYIVLMLIGFIILFSFIALQDYVVWIDKIPAWKVNASGQLIVDKDYQGPIPENLTTVEEKPNSIIIDGQEYNLINGIYYKSGYSGTAYAIGSPEVVGAIVILIILAVGTMLITYPQN